MDTKEIKQIIDLIRRYDLTEFEVEKEGLKLRIHRKASTDSSSSGRAPVTSGAAHERASESLLSTPAGPSRSKDAEDPSVYTLKSPIVGTFYRAAAPENPPLVEIGAKVTASSVIGIIEAMKVMNEIHAEASGTVMDILVANGSAIEYGQPLLKINLSPSNLTSS